VSSTSGYHRGRQQATAATITATSHNDRDNEVCTDQPPPTSGTPTKTTASAASTTESPRPTYRVRGPGGVGPRRTGPHRSPGRSRQRFDTPPMCPQPSSSAPTTAPCVHDGGVGSRAAREDEAPPRREAPMLRAVPGRATEPTTRAGQPSYVDLQVKSRIDLSVSRPATGHSKPVNPQTPPRDDIPD
jgi:hypothetical protein